MMKKDINSKMTGQITFPEFHLFEYLFYLLASVEIIGFKVLWKYGESQSWSQCATRRCNNLSTLFFQNIICVKSFHFFPKSETKDNLWHVLVSIKVQQHRVTQEGHALLFFIFFFSSCHLYNGCFPTAGFEMYW